MCKFLTYLCKYIKIDDLNEIETSMKSIIIENNLSSTSGTADDINLQNTKLAKQIKIYLNNYIYEILNDANEAFKQEGECAYQGLKIKEFS